MSPVRALVVDDSPTMRRLVVECLSRDPGIAVIGTAANAMEARTAIKDLNPDVMTLDVEMPGMDGLSFLEKVMTLRPMPVIMVSTLTAQGSDAAVAALAIGAVDCVVKPSASNQNSFDQLAAKVKMAAQSKPQQRQAKPSPAQVSNSFRAADKVVAIGSSTGGVEALITVLSQFPANCAPTVITQHMPGSFTRSLASRLNRMCPATVAEATHGAPLKPGHVYLAPGGEQHLEISGRGSFTCLLRNGDMVSGHRPSVDALFHAVARCAGAHAVGVILTGMGRDGAEGLAALRRGGARTIGQTEATCVVYGMPKAAYDIGAVETQLPLEKIAGGIIAATSQPA